MNMRATRFIWMAAGSPLPTETDGTPIRVRDMGGARCASCGELAAYRLDDAISDNFTTMRNASRAWAFGGNAICAACVWCCKSLALRCSLWFARLPDDRARGGVWFVPLRPIPGVQGRRPDPLDALLNPPPPPFVAGLPLFGIDHGGEANAHRTIWPWTPGAGSATHPRVDTNGLFIPTAPLVKLQSKHTALYAQVSHSADHYYLQVDDAGDVVVDVPLWRELRSHAGALLSLLRAAGAGAQAAREALTTLRPPLGAPLSLSAPSAWRARVAPFRPHVGGSWWSLFVALLPMPELTSALHGVGKAGAPVLAPDPKPEPITPAAPAKHQLSLF